jgi:phage gp29-like protein
LIKRKAHMAGFSVSEIVWDTTVTPWQPYLKPWDTSLFYFDKTARCLVALTEDGPEMVIPGDGKWFVHAPGGVWQAWLTGLVTPLALPWFLRMLARRDWARYSERHGMPLLKAYMPAIADAEDKKRFEGDLVTMGSEAVVTLPQGLDGEGFDVELLEAAAQSWEGFDRLITRCESAITLAVQWQNLTTEVKEGSLAAARVHGDVKQTAIELDDRAWTNDVYHQIARPFAAFNFGDAARAPRTCRDVSPLEDRLAKTQALESFSRALATLVTSGVPVDIPILAKAYRVPLPLAQAVAKQAPIFAYHMTAGVVTRNEVRERLGLPPIGGPKGEELLGAQPAGAPAPADGGE